MRTIRKGTAADLAESGTGYTANGESEHSRHIARGGTPLIDTRVDLERRLHRARCRASTHPVRLVRQRAGEDARCLEQLLARGGHHG